jgi:hypothetical protein
MNRHVRMTCAALLLVSVEALHAASYQGLTDVIEFLVSKGAKLDTKDKLGQTPLSISLSILTKEAGARRLQIPRRYRAEGKRPTIHVCDIIVADDMFAL